MKNDAEHRIVRRLAALLEAERTSLLRGDLAGISALVAEKEDLVDSLNGMAGVQPRDLEMLHAGLIRNQALLDGALQGLRNVAARLAAFRQVRRAMETYDREGNKKTIAGEVTRQVERRA